MPSPHGQQESQASADRITPQLGLLTPEPRLAAFLENAATLLTFRDTQSFKDKQGLCTEAPWPDIFFSSNLPWRGIVQSGLLHLLVVGLLLNFPHLQTKPSVQPRRSFFDHTQLTYYKTADYLPPLKIPAARARRKLRAQPAQAAQEIISVPAEPDNLRQTIAAPPAVKLSTEYRLPNLVAWNPIPSAVPIPGALHSEAKSPPITLPIIPPAPEINAAQKHRRTLPETPVIAPPRETANLASLHVLRAPQVETVPPPPEQVADHKLGRLNITKLEPQLAVPHLPIPEQQVENPGTEENAVSAVASLPDSHAMAPSRGAGPLITLGLNPADVAGPITIPNGDRRGSFAERPSGVPGGPGTPESTEGGTATNGYGTARSESSAGVNISAAPGHTPPASQLADLASGVALVTKPPRSAIPSLLASAKIPRSITELAWNTQPGLNAPDLPEVEARVFGPKKFYSMTLNMPNLNSVTGSWIIRFAELNDNGSGGDLTAPVATEKVDPAYPAQLMRTGVEGTVTLYAVIRADGGVVSIRVLSGADDRLNSYARAALARCHFRPATKNGSAVALEAVIRIPFQAHGRSF